MTVRVREVYVEQLIGREVRDSDGRVVGRIEELRSAIVDGERVVTEFHIGPAALLERVGIVATQLPLLRLLGSGKPPRSVPWESMDLDDPRHPRLRGAFDDVTTIISRSDRPSHPS
jgi:sporulation protein YlmC with PRC-barrel domain